MKKTLIATLLVLATSHTVAATQEHHMDHSTMDHSSMEHSSMDHSSMMNMGGMSEVGMPADGFKPNKVVHVILSDDMKITFKKEPDLKMNDVVQFVIINKGEQSHEFSIGSHEEQESYRENASNAKTGSSVMVKPGSAAQLTWHFHGKNNIELACRTQGHAEAGMVKELNLGS